MSAKNAFLGMQCARNQCSRSYLVPVPSAWTATLVHAKTVDGDDPALTADDIYGWQACAIFLSIRGLIVARAYYDAAKRKQTDLPYRQHAKPLCWKKAV